MSWFKTFDSKQKIQKAQKTQKSTKQKTQKDEKLVFEKKLRKMQTYINPC